jgi:hypothetical protein
MEMEKDLELKRRTTSTIPFGYRESEAVEGFLEPIENEIKALKETKEHIMNGSLSLRGAAEQLEYSTGRRISAQGLKKIVDKERTKGLLDRRE